MPRKEIVLYIFVASPGDVEKERLCLEEVVKELNLTWSISFGIRLDLVKWETHSYPALGDDAQEVINRQIKNDYDIFLGIMWQRIGTPTGRAESGTLEEFSRAKQRWDQDRTSIDIMIYFKQAPVNPHELDLEQLAGVQKFKKSLENQGLSWTFDSTENFMTLVRIHLTRVVQEYKARNAEVVDGKLDSTPRVESVPILEQDIGLFELGELFEESFADATKIIDEIKIATELIGKKMNEHTSRIDRATQRGKVSRTAAKRMLSKVAEDMFEYSRQLDQNVPTLSQHMNTGLQSLSQAISIWPDQDESQQLKTWIPNISGLREVITTVEGNMVNFQSTVDGIPKLTSDLNRARHSVSASLANLINLLRSQSEILAQAEKSAIDILDARRDK